MIPRLNISFTLAEQIRFWFGQNQYAPAEGEYLLNHNRCAITLALRAALPCGGRVGIMGYNCHTVGNAVRLAGCKPIFMDVDGNLLIDVNQLLELDLDAIIVTHLFGIVNDIDSIRKACPKAVIIEDCAHARNAIREIKGDMATFSIGVAKLPSIGDGGILVCRNLDYQMRIEELYRKLPEYSFLQELKLFVRLVAMHWLQRPLIYTMLTKPLWKRDKGVGCVLVEEPIRIMSHGISRLYAYVMAHEEEQIGALVARQLKQAECIREMLADDANVERVIVGDNAFMAIAVCQDPAILKHQLEVKGVETETHFRNTIVWAEQLGYKPGTCLNAEYMVKHVLMIPTYKEWK